MKKISRVDKISNEEVNEMRTVLNSIRARKHR